MNYACDGLLQIVRDAEKLAMRMNHRGACACDNDTGDGAGVLTAIPHNYFSHELRSVAGNLVKWWKSQKTY